MQCAPETIKCCAWSHEFMNLLQNFHLAVIEYLYRGRRAVPLQTYTTRHSNRKLSMVMALWITITQCASESTKFDKITQNKGHFAVQGHSRSPILVPIESSYTASYIKTIARQVLRIKSWIYKSARNLYRGRRAVPLQTFTTRHSIRKLSIVMALSTTFRQCAPETTKFGKITLNKGHFAVQSHRRSLIFVPIESSYTTFY